MKNYSQAALLRLLSMHEITPYLLDVGASFTPPAIWKPIAQSSRYLGFDPDDRDIPAINGYLEMQIIDKALTVDDRETQEFFLTRFPYCSSTLEPAADDLAPYFFADLFEVDRVVEAPATSMEKLVSSKQISKIDWFKTDSQGTDLRLFQSIPESVRNEIIAVDIEPGLIDVYKKEDTFVAAHQALVDEGFWLSNIDILGSQRLRKLVLPDLAKTVGLSKNLTSKALRASPGWCEARYFRPIGYFDTVSNPQRSLLLAWAFAIVDAQYGYAFELQRMYQLNYSDTDTISQMTAILRSEMRSSLRSRLFKKTIPYLKRTFVRT